MPSQKAVRYSVLDLAPILAGGTAADSFRTTVTLAQDAEALGYHRYWLAEHHSIAGIASAATAVLIGHVAGTTSSIRVGAGGIMLPNHAPLVIAEQFGTLESLYPGRIDLGLGRAPGGDGPTAQALRRNLGRGLDAFPRDVQELQAYFRPAGLGRAVRAIPGQGLRVPLYLLGSSDFSARLAAQLGLPFAFASHFAPDYIHAALALYRHDFQPSEMLAEPYVMIGVNVFAADTDAEARRLHTSIQQRFLAMLRGRDEELQPPVDSMEGLLSPPELAQLQHMLRYSAIGAPETVRHALEAFIAETQADELMMTGTMYDLAARRHSLALTAQVMREING